jgi:Leucine-rich repeat (LRR) protein
VLPSLSGLSSLTRLSLSNCNLGEGAVPNDIGYLSSLRQLDLSRNKFVSLPTSIDQLSGLQFLRMEDCKMLQSLPELPSNLEEFRVNGCTSLEKMHFSRKLCQLNYLRYLFINCWRLSESDCWNNMFPTLLRKCFQVSLSLSLSLTICILCCRALLI